MPLNVEGSPLTRLLLHYLLLPSGISFFYGLRAVHIGCPEGQLLSCVCRRPHVIFVRVCVRAYVCMYVVHGPAFALLSTCLIYVLALLTGPVHIIPAMYGGRNISPDMSLLLSVFVLLCTLSDMYALGVALWSQKGVSRPELCTILLHTLARAF